MIKLLRSLKLKGGRISIDISPLKGLGFLILEALRLHFVKNYELSKDDNIIA